MSVKKQVAFKFDERSYEAVPSELPTESSFAAPAGYARPEFEHWISNPPYERDVARWPMDEAKHAWPGQYKDIAVQLAWDAWQQAHNGELTDAGPVTPASRETQSRHSVQ